MDTKPKLYLETTIPSYLVARPSRDVVILAHQQVTRDWWDNRRDDYDIHISQLVVDEAGEGDAVYSRLRLELIAGFPLLDITPEVRSLGHQLMTALNLPSKASADALHVAVATHNGMDFVLTWNCAHLANAYVRRSFQRFAVDRGWNVPVICTPDELINLEV